MIRTLANWFKGANRFGLVAALLVTCALAAPAPAMLFTGTSGASVDCYSVDPSTGWTKTCTSVDTNIIYVSDSLGLDTYDGSSPVHTTGNIGPVKTLAYATTNTSIGTLASTLGAGNAGLRVAKPDWLLLRKGDTWLDQILGNYSYVGVMLASGRSATERLLISSYSETGVTALNPRGTGTGARPLIKGGLTNTQRFNGFGFTFGTTQDSWQYLDYFAVIGIEWYDYRRDPANVGTGYDSTVIGQAFIGISNPTNAFTIEDCKFSYGLLGVGTGGNNSQSITASVSGSAGSTVMNVTAVATTGFVGLNTSFSFGAIRVAGAGLISFPPTYINLPTTGTGASTGGVGTYGISNYTYTVVENGTTTLTGFPNFGTSYAGGLTPGIGTLSVSGTNIPASTTVASIPATFNMTGTLNGTTTVSGLSSTAAPMYVGASIAGVNIPNGTTVASITNGTTIVMSAAATGSGSTLLQFMPNAVILSNAATGSGTFDITFDQNIGSTALTVTDDEGRHSISHQNVVVRRNITAYNYPLDSGLSVGMLLSQIANLTDEENYMINDGWYDGVTGFTRSTFNHGHYIHENDNSFAPTGQISNISAVGNTAINNSFAGIWCRSCRNADNNLAYGNTLGIGYGYNLATPYNPTNAITNNVVMKSVANTGIPGSPTWGLELNSTRTGLVAVPVHNNLVANAVQPDPTGTNNWNAMFIGVPSATAPPQQAAATVTGNTFCNWPLAGGASASVVDYTPSQLNTITPNVDQPSNCTGLGPAPTRDLSSYSLSLGGANSLAGYIALILGTPGTLSGQSRDNWNPALTAPAANTYFRAGYGLTAYP